MSKEQSLNSYDFDTFTILSISECQDIVNDLLRKYSILDLSDYTFSKDIDTIIDVLKNMHYYSSTITQKLINQIYDSMTKICNTAATDKYINNNIFKTTIDREIWNIVLRYNDSYIPFSKNLLKFNVNSYLQNVKNILQQYHNDSQLNLVQLKENHIFDTLEKLNSYPPFIQKISYSGSISDTSQIIKDTVEDNQAHLKDLNTIIIHNIESLYTLKKSYKNILIKYENTLKNNSFIVDHVFSLILGNALQYIDNIMNSIKAIYTILNNYLNSLQYIDHYIKSI